MEKPEIDCLAVGRKSDELEAAHGQDGARRYAARLALQALAEGEAEEHAFWKAVENSLTPR
jgi:hypothetical protein